MLFDQSGTRMNIKCIIMIMMMMLVNDYCDNDDIDSDDRQTIME